MEKLKRSIQIFNLDLHAPSKRKVDMFPNIMRGVILGPSGCGKTNVLLTILCYKKPLYDIYLCSKTAYQEKYSLLDELVDKHNATSRQKITITKVNVDNLPEPEDVKENSIIIFDDVLTEKQDKIASYYQRGRHRNLTCLYLAQSYTKIPKKSGIRENFNYLILFKQDIINLRQIYNEHIISISFNTFKEYSSQSWKTPFGFLVVDLEHSTNIFKNRFEFSYK